MEEFEKFIDNNENFMSVPESKNHNALVFAFVGDAVFSMYVRTFLACRSTAKAGVLHSTATKFVRASYQGILIEQLEHILTEEETRIVNTARNLKTNNIAKHSSIEEYKKSTSFEALLGYLYLTHQNDRLVQILSVCKKQMENDL